MITIGLLVIIYIAFISLGLPDSLIGSAWPSMYQSLKVPINYAGILTMITTGGTIISSLMSDRFIRRFNTERVTTFSVFLTAFALLGISFTVNFYVIACFCLVLGLGAGSVDTALNNYVAINFKAKHMSWLHCFWGLGAFSGPLIMSHFLREGYLFTTGFRAVSIIQFVLGVILVISLPLWKKHEKLTRKNDRNDAVEQVILSKSEILKLKGAKEALGMFLCYCAIEATFGLWVSTYLVVVEGLSVEMAAGYGFLFYFGITLGRFISGFLTHKLNNRQLINLGIGIILLGLILIMLPLNINLTLMSFLLVGLGCAPIFPCMIHETQNSFGQKYSQSIIGVQMACAYIGSSLMPPFFGFLASYLGYNMLPYYASVFIILLALMQISQRKKLAYK